MKDFPTQRAGIRCNPLVLLMQIYVLTEMNFILKFNAHQKSSVNAKIHHFLLKVEVRHIFVKHKMN